MDSTLRKNYHMVGVDGSSTNTHFLANRRVLVFVLSLLTLLAPMFCYISSVDIYIASATWIYSLSSQDVFFFPIMFTIPLTMLRFLFAYQINRYYEGMTTRGKTLALGILADGPGFLLLLVMVITLLVPSLWVYIFYPTPLLFLSGALVLWRKPIPKPKTPWDGFS